MDERLKIVCFYDNLNSRFRRRYILSATTKLDYVISVLNKLGYAVDIISAAVSEGGQLAVSNTRTINMGVNTLTTFGCIALPSKRITRNLSTKIVTKKLKKYLDRNIRSNDIVLVYHSPRYANILTDLRKNRNFTLIGEIEEIYQDVRSMGEKVDSEEYGFFSACDKYIFPTQLLNDKLNKDNKKKSITIHGLYSVEPDRHVSFGDNKIHVVYAGTFDPRKGGVAAAAAAEFLSENYHVHICGFGSQTDTDEIKKIIKEVSLKSKAELTFHGLLKGNDFIEFIQKCHIGLSTQEPSAAFNATSFPSKILNYLSNGLKVVTIDIPAIRSSDVGKHLFYYEKQTPKEIAKAIEKAQDEKNFDSRALLQSLDVKFVADLNTFLQ